MRRFMPRYLVDSAEAYRSIADRIVAKAPRGIDHALKSIRAKVENLEIGDIDSIRAEINAFAQACDRPSVVKDLAHLAQSQGELQKLYRPLLKRAFQLNPLDDQAFFELKRILLRRDSKAELLQLLEASYAAATALPDKDAADSAIKLVDELGALAMSLGRHDLAAKAYGWTGELPGRAQPQTKTDITSLASTFNHIEALRRAGMRVDQEQFQQLVNNFNACFPETARSTSADFANKLQAISIPLALLGRVKEAAKDLCEAKAIVEIMPEDEIFSVLTYQNESPDLFTRHCEEMLGAILRHELWDGTKLPEQV